MSTDQNNPMAARVQSINEEIARMELIIANKNQSDLHEQTKRHLTVYEICKYYILEDIKRGKVREEQIRKSEEDYQNTIRKTFKFLH
jgi:hypothetical protein